MNTVLSAGQLSGLIVPAGMPSLQPTDFTLLRMQTLSFFLLVLVLCTVGVRWIWNHLAGEFPSLPRLTFKAAGAVVVLWGLVFVLVLTMISGARELMTPGAWERNGSTWRLASPPEQPPAETTRSADPRENWNSDEQLTVRRDSLRRLWTSLWQHALQHDGQFPTTAEYAQLPADERSVTGQVGIFYRYVPDRDADQLDQILVYEPEISGPLRLALRVDGSVSLVDLEWLQDNVPPGPEIHQPPPARQPVEAPRPPAASGSEEDASAAEPAAGEAGTDQEAAP